MVVAVVAVLMVQATVDDVVGVVAVRYGFVAAVGAVNVAGAIVYGVAAVGIGVVNFQTVFVVVAVVFVMQVAVVQVIDMVAVLNGGMAAAAAVNMVMVGVCRTVAHGASF